MRENLGLEAIKKIQEIAPTSFLLFGTLLGCVRNNSFISWDRDIDMGILFEDWKEEYIEKFKKEGFVFLTEVYWSNQKMKDKLNEGFFEKRSKVQMYYKEKDIRMCFEIFGKGENDCRYSGCGGNKFVFFCPEDLILETIEYDFYNIKVNIPKKYEEFLEFIYGKNWKIPNKSYIGNGEYKIKQKLWKIFLD